MFIPFKCPECRKLGIGSKEAMEKACYRDDGIYEITCKRGHQFTGTFQSHLHQILYEIGANAILDGYYRESVSSFASSLERFFEFYISVCSLSLGIDIKEFKNSWKMISAQSERQFGAFIYTYLIVNKKQPTLPTEKYRSFRNGVIHKGKIPSRGEAIEYGDVVKDTIEELTLELDKSHSSSVNRITRIYLDEVTNNLGKLYDTSVSTSMIIGMSEGEISNWGRPKLEGHLKRLSQIRAYNE